MGRASKSDGLRSCRVSGTPPYYLLLDTSDPMTSIDVERAVLAAVKATTSEIELVQTDEEPRLEKYDEFVPGALLQCALAADRLNLNDLSIALTISANEAQVRRATQISNC